MLTYYKMFYVGSDIPLQVWIRGTVGITWYSKKKKSNWEAYILQNCSKLCKHG
jgi:hypothetical protein